MEGQSERLTYRQFQNKDRRTEGQPEEKKEKKNGLTNRQTDWLAPFSILKVGSVEPNQPFIVFCSLAIKTDGFKNANNKILLQLRLCVWVWICG